jgi:negative regulator of flagellin synthesis FlgM
MIDGLGRAGLQRLAVFTNDAPGRAAATTPAVSTPRVAAGKAGQLVREMAVTPPVDSARVGALRQAIAAGSYKPDPQAIAAAMLRLESGSGR